MLHGVRLMSLESAREKESVSALEYSREVLRAEVESELSGVLSSNVSTEFIVVSDSLCVFLQEHYTEQDWREYLSLAGLDGKTKKDAELFLNVCSAVIVTSILSPLLEVCASTARRFGHRRMLRVEAQRILDVSATALEMLEKYNIALELYSLQQFEAEYGEVLQKLYESLNCS